jgi:uncharacterized sulfatase
MGHPDIRTPALDRLARESVVFERGYSPVPLCRPALASIVTGLHPHQHGVTGNDPDLPDKTVNPQTQRTNPRFQPYYEKLVARFASHPYFIRDLTARGYVALQTGKWWEGDPVKTAGFTHAMTRGEGKGGRHGDAGLAIGREALAPIYDFIGTTVASRSWCGMRRVLPHAPHNPPRPCSSASKTRRAAGGWLPPGCVAGSTKPAGLAGFSGARESSDQYPYFLHRR